MAGETPIQKFEKAGKIAFDALQYGKKQAKVGMPLLDLANLIEARIVENGALPAFPVNLSINEVAAHFTPGHDDDVVIGEKDLLKIDAGAQIDGFIGDTALSVDFSKENGKLVEASEKALGDAISTIRAGVKISEIGAAVESAIKSYGFKPIENLTGHSLAQYNLHAGTEVPNIASGSSKTLKEGDVVAVEPFASTGAGHVSEGGRVEIYSLVSQRPTRMREARRLQAYVYGKYKTLPFAERWLYSEFKSTVVLHSAMRELVLSASMHQYPILKDVKGSHVAQTEVTLVVEKDSARILTK